MKIGDDHIQKSLYEDEYMNMDLVYFGLDCYKNSISLSKEKNLELEAVVRSKVGKIFYLALKNEKKANDEFLHCIRLAASLFPKVVTTEKWY